MIGGKFCCKCKEFKEYEEFGIDRNRKDGRHPQCKKCRSENRNKDWEKEYKRKYYQQNKKIIEEKKKKYKEENKEYIKQWKKEWYRTNIERITEQRKAFYQANKERICKTVREYAKTEQGKETLYRARVKRRSDKNNVRFTPLSRRKIIERDNWTCQNCGHEVHDNKENDEYKAHIDHIKPISKGGNSEPKNLRTLCRTCNLTKHNSEDEQLKLF